MLSEGSGARVAIESRSDPTEPVQAVNALTAPQAPKPTSQPRRVRDLGGPGRVCGSLGAGTVPRVVAMGSQARAAVNSQADNSRQEVTLVSDPTATISEALAGPLSALGLDLEAVEITPAGKRRVLRVAVDKDGGVTLDDIAEATRDVSTVLDDRELMGAQAYTLEVTSRGIDRPLTLPRHWRRNTGRLVEIRRADLPPLRGRITGCDDVAAQIEVNPGEHLSVPYDDVGRAVIQIEFNRPEGHPEGKL